MKTILILTLLLIISGTISGQGQKVSRRPGVRPESVTSLWGPDLFSDGDFESAQIEKPPADWTISDWNSPLEITVSEGSSAGGDTYLRAVRNGSGGHRLFSPRIEVEPGDYMLIFWYRHEFSTNRVPARVIYIETFSENGSSALKYHYYPYYGASIDTLKNGQWQSAALQLKYYPDTTAVRIIIPTHEISETLSIDQIQFRKLNLPNSGTAIGRPVILASGSYCIKTNDTSAASCYAFQATEGITRRGQMSGIGWRGLETPGIYRMSGRFRFLDAGSTAADDAVLTLLMKNDFGSSDFDIRANNFSGLEYTNFSTIFLFPFYGSISYNWGWNGKGTYRNEFLLIEKIAEVSRKDMLDLFFNGIHPDIPRPLETPRTLTETIRPTYKKYDYNVVPLPVGEHPRLLFRMSDLPRFRTLLATTEGKRVMQRLKIGAWGGLPDVSGTVPLSVAITNQTWRDQMVGMLKITSGVNPLYLVSFTEACEFAALLWLLEKDTVSRDIALGLFRLWIEGRIDGSAGIEHPRETPTLINREILAAFDMLHNDLGISEREKVYRFLASLGREVYARFTENWWLEAPTRSGRRTANWTAIDAPITGLLALTLENQSGFDKNLLNHCLRLTEEFLSEGIAADGAMYEGVEYAGGYGTKDLPDFIAAMRLRGIDLLSRNSNSLNVPLWLAHQYLPWGHECQPLNKSAGRVGCGEFITMLGNVGGNAGSWLFSQTSFLGDRYGAPPMTTLLYGLPKPTDWTPSKFPQYSWFSAVNQSFSRSGWQSEYDVHLTVMNNVIGAGHSHGDNGSFTLAALGNNFISDAGGNNALSRFHNVVHINGQGQPAFQDKGGMEGSAEGWTRFVDSTGMIDIHDLDLRLSYSRRLNHLHPYSDLVVQWQDWNPVEHADRRILFVRHRNGAYVVTADDIKKDEKNYKYEWYAHTPLANRIEMKVDGFELSGRYQGTFISTKKMEAEASWLMNVPSGSWRAFVLYHAEPNPQNPWSYNYLTINSKIARTTHNRSLRTYPIIENKLVCNWRLSDGLLPDKGEYTSMPRRGDYNSGWQWLQLFLDDALTVQNFVLDKKLEVLLRCHDGGRVAAIVFSRKTSWSPHSAQVPAGDIDTIVLRAEDAKRSGWDLHTNHYASLSIVFVTPEKVTVSHEIQKEIPGLPLIKAATTSAEGVRFLTVLLPHRSNDGISVSTRGGVGKIVLPEGYDLVCGPLTNATLIADGALNQIAFRKTTGDPVLSGYSLCAGRMLSVRGQKVVHSTGGSFTVLNDGIKIVVRGYGIKTEFLRLGAASLVINGKPGVIGSGEYVKVIVPPLPAFSSRISDDGRRVYIDGDGVHPCKVYAPTATEVLLNGISRYFTRDSEGNVYPQLPCGTFIPTEWKK